jgi:hypothetical protein
MEPTNFIREILNRITPEVLQGEKILTPDNETRINLSLKKAAVKSFAAGKLAEAKEINIFIQANPKFKIWPGNGVLFMAQNSTEPDKDKIIIYADQTHIGQYEKLIEKVEEINSKNNE